MAETGVPSDLTPLKEPFVEAVINAWMAKKITDETDWTWTHHLCEDGEFRYKHDRFGLDSNVYVSYPGGQWKEDWTWQGDPERDPGYTIDDMPLFDAAAIYEQARTAVDDWLDPWIESSDPNDLTPQIELMARVVDQLYVQDEVRLGDTPLTDDPHPTTSVPVTDVESAIADMGSNLSSLNGLAIDALEAAYVNDVGKTISGQRAMAAVAALAIGGEAEAWGRAYGDLAAFVTQATDDLNSFAKSHGTSGGEGATTLSVISGVAGAAGAASFAFPPAAAVLGVISGLAGIGSAFWPGEEPGRAAVILALEGDDFDSLWDSFRAKVRDVSSEITDAEYSLAMMCRNVLDKYGTSPDSFSITDRGSGNTPQAGDNLPRFLDTNENSAPIELYAGDLISIVHSKLRAVSGMIEHVGDHQRTVAGSMGSASGGSGWSRGYLEGGIIGWGPTGHEGDYTRLVDELVDLLMMESRTAHRVAEHCLDVSTGFSKTDGQIEAELDRLESRLDA